MMKEQDNIINCSRFEELLSDYLDKTLDNGVQRSVAEHAIACPLCHTLLNEVKESLEVCRTIAAPAPALTRLEARVLAATTPGGGMACSSFEWHLTDYLDGFLPAKSFHQWERHAAMCGECEDLPGMVVRSIGACLTYKLDELAVPAGLNQRILNVTSELGPPKRAKTAWASRASEWVKELRWPIGVPQLASVAAMLTFAFFVFSQTVSADGTLAGVYQKGIELAGQTYQQSADALNGKPVSIEQPISQQPVDNTTFVGNEEKK